MFADQADWGILSLIGDDIHYGRPSRIEGSTQRFRDLSRPLHPHTVAAEGLGYLRVIEVAEVAGITEVTIRNRYKELAEELDIEIIL